jgi:ABC-type Fe3+/spermidine/putrescine transport system ATPase subunit
MGHTNLFAATLERESSPERSGGVRCGDRMFSVASTNGLRAGDRVTALIPPDFIALSDPPTQASNQVNATLTGVTPLGEMTSLSLRFDEKKDQSLRFKISAREAASRNAHVGDAVSVWLDPAGIHLMPQS